jgi:GNAT superfamily N-acetyltransferase
LARDTPTGVRFIVEPSPAGGFHIRLAGVAAPLSHHDTEEDAQARRQAYERGTSGGEFVDLADGSEVLISQPDPTMLRATDPRSGEELGVATYLRDRDRPTSAEATVVVVDGWRGRGLGGALLKRLSRRAAADGIDTFTAWLRIENASLRPSFERLGAVEMRGDALKVELPVADAAVLLRNVATGYVRSRD